MTDIRMKDILWLELTRIPGLGLKRITCLRRQYCEIERIWEATEEELIRLAIPEKPRCALRKGPDLAEGEQLLSRWNHQGLFVYSYENPWYPTRLKQIYDAPPILYAAGQTALMKTDMMALVGARRCTSYGSRVALELGRVLTEKGYTVVSGMAYGIDAWSHQGALDAGGSTVAVLGCGVDVCYPPQHQGMMNQIRKKGLLLSEYPPGTAPRAGFFPQRNRIISGLCRGVIVVEAGEKSGSLITADQALEQGRDVYCVPGSIFSPASRGVHRLIQQGAMLLSGYEDLPTIRGTAYPVTVDQPVLDREEEKRVYQAVREEGSTLYELERTVGLSVPVLQQTLTALEMRGLLRQTLDYRWIR